jgi:hypothetical protein
VNRALPILFGPEMVRAIRSGLKTQTRRAIKWLDGNLEPKAKYIVGERLWVREPWRTFVSLDTVKPRDLLEGGRGAGVRYEAGGSLSIGKEPDRARHYSNESDDNPGAMGKLRQSMFMPRWASRLMLTVTDVRVQRLQEISEDDAFAEGIRYLEDPPPSNLAGFGHGDYHTWDEPVGAYRILWEEINGAGSWDANPLVARYSFSVEQKKIDGLVSSKDNVRLETTPERA